MKCMNIASYIGPCHELHKKVTNNGCFLATAYLSIYLQLLARSILNIMPGSANFEIKKTKKKQVAQWATIAHLGASVRFGRP